MSIVVFSVLPFSLLIFRLLCHGLACLPRGSSKPGISKGATGLTGHVSRRSPISAPPNPIIYCARSFGGETLPGAALIPAN